MIMAALPKVISVSSFTPVNNEIARGLEAADFVAWHWNKHYRDKIRDSKGDESRKDFAAHNRPNLCPGDKVKILFSPVPRDVSV